MVESVTTEKRPKKKSKTAALAAAEPPYPGCWALIDGDFRAWAKLWDKKAAVAPRLPISTFVRLYIQHLGLRATLIYRFSHALWRARFPFLPGMLQRMNVVFHGFDIPSRVPIGPGLYMPHPVGVTVMAERIGSNVTLVGSITIGMRNELAFPLIGDNVLVGVGARILGDITIGNDAKIGANAVVVRDVPSGATAIGVPAIIKLPADTGT